MAKYFTDFSEYTAGVQPSDWTRRYEANTNWLVEAKTGALSGQALVARDGSGRNGLSWDAIDSDAGRDDVEILFRTNWSSVGAGQNEIFAMARASGESLTATIYRHGLRDVSSTDEVIALQKYENGSFTEFGGPLSYPFTDNEWIWVRVRVNGSSHKLWIWKEGEVEPTSPQLDETDAGIAAAGWVGFFKNKETPYSIFVDRFGVGTNGDTAPSEAVTATPTITDINTNNEVTPGETATLTGTNLTGATGFNIGTEAQTDFTVVSDTSVTFTTVRGGNPYNQNLTGTLLHPDGNQTITVQQVPEAGTFAVTAASPNTTDDASLWTGLIDTATSNPITIVDGDQAWVKNPNNLTNLAIQPDGTITADQTGDFVVQIWLASEGVWGSDQTVTFDTPDTTAPTITSVDVPTADSYKAGDVLTFTSNFSESVDVTGTPAINFSVDGSPRQANYSSGTGSSALVFTYTVQSGDDTSGLSVTSLSLDGGTIADTAGNAADLTLVSVGDTSGIIIDTIAPTVAAENVTTTNTSPAISGTASGVDQVSVVVNGVTYTPAVTDGTWVQQLPTLAIGDYPITVDATDDAGNDAVQDTATLSIIEVGSGVGAVVQKLGAGGATVFASEAFQDSDEIAIDETSTTTTTIDANGNLDTTSLFDVVRLNVYRPSDDTTRTYVVFVRPAGVPVKPFYKFNWSILTYL